MPENHQVLIFGEKVYGSEKPNLEIDYCDVDIISFPSEFDQLTRFANYDLVLLDYSAFLCGKDLFERKQEIFEKQMMEGLENGTNFLILHYDEYAPADGYSKEGGMNESDIAKCEERQIGFRWLRKLKIRPHRFDSPIIMANIVRNEFKLYQERWGASKNIFKPYGGGEFGDVIFSFDNKFALGFVIPIKRGKLIYLPCQRDFSQTESIRNCLVRLINSTITYLSRSSIQMPSGAQAPLFPRETKLNDKISKLETKIDEMRKEIKPYEQAKALAYKSRYKFEKAVPEFLEEHLQLNIFREERYKEDFWILNPNEERIIIAETKTYHRGFKKRGIFDLYNHREHYGLEETFPALLIVNAHLNAKSWKNKIRPLDPQVYKAAARNNITLMRIEDLLFFWNNVVNGQRNIDVLISTIIENNGWIEVKKSGDIEHYF